MTLPESPAKRLRRALDGDGVTAAGCFDALSARLAEHAGFKALYVTGFGVEATQLGAPDVGMITLTELASHAARIAAATTSPIICDGEAGFGDLNQVSRTIRELHRSGVAGVHIEDQASPKRCPILRGRTVVTREEAVDRIKAACAARIDSDFVIIARTDSDEISMDEVITRSNLYLEAGADMAMPMTARIDGVSFSRRSPEHQMNILTTLASEIRGPLLGIFVPEGYRPRDLLDVGFRAVVLPTLSLDAATTAMLLVLQEAVEDGSASSYFSKNPPLLRGRRLMDLLGIDSYLETLGEGSK